MGAEGSSAAYDKAGNRAPHAFNVINQRGSIVFLESQSLGGGVELIPDAYDWAFDVFYLLRTHVTEPRLITVPTAAAAVKVTSGRRTRLELAEGRCVV